MAAVKLDRPLLSVSLLKGDAILNDNGVNTNAMGAGQAASLKALETQRDRYRNACLMLEGLAGRLNELCEELFAGHHEAIARLSVEIARKILMQRVAEGDYSIEAIIREALKSVPEGRGIVVRVNPQDLENIRSLQNEDYAVFSGIDFTADSVIGRAECIVESPKGIIKYLIAEHLEQIHKALAGTE